MNSSRLVPSVVSGGAVQALPLACEAEVGVLPLLEQLDVTVHLNRCLLALCARRLAGNADAASDTQGI